MFENDANDVFEKLVRIRILLLFFDIIVNMHSDHHHHHYYHHHHSYFLQLQHCVNFIC